MVLYEQGARFEREVIRQLLDSGAISVVRAAGSKSYGMGKIDLVAMFEDKAWVVQCKRHGLIGKQEREEGYELSKRLSTYAHVMLAYYKGGMHFTEFKDFSIGSNKDLLTKKKQTFEDALK